MRSVEEITPAVEDKLAKLGLELYEIKFFRAGRHAVLRVFIDKPGGVTIDDCERAGNELSIILDVEVFSNRPYTLEVSSPGLDRPLTRPKDFRRACGHEVTLKMIEPLRNKQRLSGTILACDDETVEFQWKDELIRIPLDNIESGRIEISFKQR